jgi:hypothetical protein
MAGLALPTRGRDVSGIASGSRNDQVYGLSIFNPSNVHASCRSTSSGRTTIGAS